VPLLLQEFVRVNERPQRVCDLGVPRKEFLAINRFAAIEPLKIVPKRSVDPRIFGPRRFRLIGHGMAHTVASPKASTASRGTMLIRLSTVWPKTERRIRRILQNLIFKWRLAGAALVGMRDHTLRF
jgi:hypothetical protein